MADSTLIPSPDVRSPKAPPLSNPAALDVQRIRKDFPILAQQVNGKPLVYLDNAATSQKPRQVIDAVKQFYEQDNANVHRSLYQLGERATQAYEGARQKVAGFIGARDWRSIVFTKGATEAINLVAYAWGRHNLGPGDEVLITEMEHHSNMIPWQLLARDTGATLRYIPIMDDHALDMDVARQLITPRTKLVCMVHQSNVFGTVNPVKELTNLAHKVGALMLLDGAQSVPHFKVDVEDLDCDFMAFSGHKMLGPTGVGALYGKAELLESMEPFLGGGEMIRTVTMEQATWNDIPWKFEAGTPNIAQAVGLGAAVEYLSELGMDSIQQYVDKLTEYGRQRLIELPGLTLYGHRPTSSAVLPFNVDGIHPHDLAQILDDEGIAIRAGHHCAQPLMHRLDVTATCRASFYFYNTFEEIDRLVAGLEAARSFMGQPR